VSRSRYLDHIINLAAMAFIFSKKAKAFEAIIDRVNDSTPRLRDHEEGTGRLEEERTAWKDTQHYYLHSLLSSASRGVQEGGGR
jgi:hypothetical protein